MTQRVQKAYKWDGGSSYPLTLRTRVGVRFRDGAESELGTVGDWYGAGGNGSNWSHNGDALDIVEYWEVEA